MNSVFNRLFSLLVISMLILSSCEEENIQEPSVIAEEILFVSGENARFLGRIISLTNNLQDHGFYISEDQNFANPKIVSLGERNKPGKFIGEVGGLKIQKEYFVKAFIKIGEKLIFSEIITIKTLKPVIESFSPASGLPSDIITISGSNFTNDTKVFFGGREVLIIKKSFESQIQVRVPAMQNKSSEVIKVISQGNELIFTTPFEYIIGKYTKISNLPFNDRVFDNVSLLQNNGLYIGLGVSRSNSLVSNIWKYNLSTSNWLEIPFTGRSLTMAFSSTNYFGGGINVVSRPPYSFSRDFWSFNNGNFVKLPDLPFDNAKSQAFEIENGLYVIGGETGLSNFIMFYDKLLKVWKRLPDAPFSITKETINFHYQGNHYFVNNEKDLFKYQLSNNTWILVTKFPGGLGVGGGLALVIDDKVYIGLGGRAKDLWELNMQNLNWVRKNDFVGPTTAFNVGAFTQGGLLYFVRSGERELPGPMELWAFNPNEF